MTIKPQFSFHFLDPLCFACSQATAAHSCLPLHSFHSALLCFSAGLKFYNCTTAHSPPFDYISPLWGECRPPERGYCLTVVQNMGTLKSVRETVHTMAVLCASVYLFAVLNDASWRHLFHTWSLLFSVAFYWYSPSCRALFPSLAFLSGSVFPPNLEINSENVISSSWILKKRSICFSPGLHSACAAESKQP